MIVRSIAEHQNVEFLVHTQNVANFTRQLTFTTDEAKRKVLRQLLAEEHGKVEA